MFVSVSSFSVSLVNDVIAVSRSNRYTRVHLFSVSGAVRNGDDLAKNSPIHERYGIIFTHIEFSGYLRNPNYEYYKLHALKVAITGMR